MWVRFGLSESDSATLPGGQLKPEMLKNVELILPNEKIYDKQGKINFLASTIDTSLGTQQLRAEFDNKAGQLLPGQFVRIRLSVGERKDVIPRPAIGCRTNRTGPSGDGCRRRQQSGSKADSNRRMGGQGLGGYARTSSQAIKSS